MDPIQQSAQCISFRGRYSMRGRVISSHPTRSLCSTRHNTCTHTLDLCDTQLQFGWFVCHLLPYELLILIMIVIVVFMRTVHVELHVSDIWYHTFLWLLILIMIVIVVFMRTVHVELHVSDIWYHTSLWC